MTPTAAPTVLAARTALGVALAGLPPEVTAGVRVVNRAGVVVLRGAVPSVAAWQLLREAVLAAPGVRAVADELEVTGSGALTHGEASEAVARSVGRAVRGGGAVAVRTNGGVTSLSGHVPTGRIRQRVLGAVRAVMGGGWVQTGIVIG